MPCGIVILNDYGDGTDSLVKVMLDMRDILCWFANCKRNVNDQKVQRTKKQKGKMMNQDLPPAKRLCSSINAGPSGNEDPESKEVPCVICDLKEGKRKKAKHQHLALIPKRVIVLPQLEMQIS